MVCIRLYGDFALFLNKNELFYNVKSVKEAFEAIYANFPNARKYIIEKERNGLFFRIVINEERILEDSHESSSFSNIFCIDIIPCLIGNGPFAAQIFITVAVAAVSAGVSAILTPKPKFATQKNEVSANAGARSTFFGGRTNNLTQGAPVPVVYGRIKAGSNVISARIRNFNILKTGDFSSQVNRLLSKYSVGKTADLTQFESNIITRGIKRTDLYPMPYSFTPGIYYRFIDPIGFGEVRHPVFSEAIVSSRNYNPTTKELKVLWNGRLAVSQSQKSYTTKTYFPIEGYSILKVK